VNQQGRKKVPIPMISGAKSEFSFFLKKEKREVGRVMVLFL